MAIPNTTPTPNELYNGEMQKMSDAELRVVMIVTRATFGWIIDKKTGLRKEEDWISLSQMIKKSGKSIRAIKYAVQSCIDKGWIEVRSKNGELLDTGIKRQKHGKKLYYRLGYRLLGRVKNKTSAKSAQAKPVQKKTGTSAIYDMKPVQKKTLYYTKENITKEIHTKGVLRRKRSNGQAITGKNLNYLIGLFEKVNPNFERIYPNKSQREALSRLIKKHGLDKIERVIKLLPKIINRAYAPRVTTPYQLEIKLGEIIAFLNQEKTKSKNEAIKIEQRKGIDATRI
jgi:hypothetical protein